MPEHPVAESPDATERLKEEKPPDVVLQPQDIISITRRFQEEHTDYYRDVIIDEQLLLVRQLNGLLTSFSSSDDVIIGDDQQPCSSTQSDLRQQCVDAIDRDLTCLQSAAFAGRCIASQEAAVVFGVIRKHKPIEQKVKRSKLGKGTRKEKETAASSGKPERLLTREKTAAKLFSPNMDDLMMDTPIAVNRGKRRGNGNGRPQLVTTPLLEKLSATPTVVAEKRPKKDTNGSVKKRTSNRLSKTPRINTKEDDEPTYCFCSRISYGEMIGCDNDKCEIEWFHFECIGLTTKPKGKWFCPNCRHPDSARVMKGGNLKKELNMNGVTKAEEPPQ